MGSFQRTNLPASKLVRVWEISSGRLLNQIELWSLISCFRFKYQPSEICFTQDLDTIAVGCVSCESMSSLEARCIHLIDVVTKKELAKLPGHKSDIESLAVSPDGRYLASGSWSGEIKIWDLQSGDEVVTLEAKNGSIQALTFSPDGSTLASGAGGPRPWGQKFDVLLWSTASWSRMLELQFGLDVYTIDFSADSKALAVGGGRPFGAYSSALLRIFDAGTGSEIKTLVGGQTVPENHRCVMCVSFSPSGDLLASGSDDNFVRLWDMRSWENAGEADTGETVYDIAFSPDGHLLASAQAALKGGKTSVYQVEV